MPTLVDVNPKLSVELPHLPNFLRGVEGVSVPVEQLSEADLLKLSGRWTAALLRHAEQRRKLARQAARAP